VPRVKPKKKCCGSKPRCRRCPIRLLADGALPPGYTVRKRRLVKVAGPGGDLRPLLTKDEKKKKKKKKKSAAKAGKSRAGRPRVILAA
jgi:hypothetical protein